MHTRAYIFIDSYDDKTPSQNPSWYIRVQMSATDNTFMRREEVFEPGDVPLFVDYLRKDGTIQNALDRHITELDTEIDKLLKLKTQMVILFESGRNCFKV